MNKTLAIIPARGGSKGIPKKNIKYLNGKPLIYWTISAALKSKLEKAKKENKLPKIIIPVHLSGQSCSMKEIHNLSKKYGFKIYRNSCRN